MAYLSLNGLCGIALLILALFSGNVWADAFDFDLADESAASQSEGLRFSALFESRNQKMLRDTGWLSARQRLKSELYYSQPYWQGFISTNADYDPAAHKYRSTTRVELGEAYVILDGALFSLPQTFVTFGKQRITWGATDGRSTIDLLNAVNFRDPIGNGRTLNRRPSWLLRTEHKADFGIFDLVWMPRGKDRKLPEYGSPWEPPSLHQLRESERAGLINHEWGREHKPETAARFIHYGKGLDWGFAYFDGYTDLPFYTVTGARSVKLATQRQQTWNASAALSLNSNTWRIEAAYTPDMPVYQPNGQMIERDLQQVIFGWDRTFDDNLYGNLQVYWDRYRGDSDDYGVTFAVSRPFYGEALTLGTSGQYGYRGQYSVEAYAEYALNDHWTFTLRNYYFGGPPQSSLGQYADNDFAEIDVRYSF